MKITDLWYLVTWLTSGGITYWLVTETNGSQLKKENPTVYNSLQEKPEDLKTKITEAETELTNLKTQYDQKKQEVEAKEEGEEKETAKGELRTQEAELAKKEATLSLYQSIDKFGLKMPVLSLNNIGKTLGLFAFLAIISCLITKKILGIFSKKDN